jgi:hypothetical protein
MTGNTTHVRYQERKFRIVKSFVIEFIKEFEGDKFRLERGVTDGDPVKPKLFTCLLEHIFRKLTEATDAAFTLLTLIFAGDIVL